MWPQSGPVPGVCKADQVPDKIIEANQAKALEKSLTLSPENRRKIAAFLVALNMPLVKLAEASSQKQATSVTPITISPTVPEPSTNTAVGHTCKHCGSTSMEIRYSFNYFFFCRDCEKNTPIKATCPACGELAKLRKQKKEFYVECENGAHSALYFVNT